MYRSGFVKSASCTLLLVTAIYVVSAACGEALAPCAVDTSKHEARGLLDAGTWQVTTINGQPAQGWALPLPSFDFFYSGVINFRTERTDASNCDEIKTSAGEAVAQYALRKSNGSLSANKRFVGRFEYDHVKNTLRLTAAGYVINGTVSGHTMTLPAAHALFGSATVVLQR
jgi:hypothetical protein